MTELGRSLESLGREELLRLYRLAVQGLPPPREDIQLERGARGEVLPTIQNFLQILRGDSHFATIRFNKLTQRPEQEVGGETRPWTDADEAAARAYIEGAYKLHRPQKLEEALRLLFAERGYNPAIEAIEKTTWDGHPRIGGFLSKCMGCEDSPYTREVSRLLFAGGIHRLYHPGCKFEAVPVLVGTRQGEGKSTLVRWLALEDAFFREVNEIEGQKGIEAIEGAWICEMGELLALTRTREIEGVKAFISRQVDHYRRPYDKRTSDHPRSCLFIGTTNKGEFLTDQTGNRRFYPLVVRQTGYELFRQKEQVQRDIRQCWAEAKALFDQNQLPPYFDPELLHTAQEIQRQALEDDYRIGMIAHYLEGKTQVCIMELWQNALDNPGIKPQRWQSNEIGLIMQGMKGWVRSKGARYTNGFGRQKCWVREELPEGDGTLLP